jgi:hypothetical protein
MRKTLKKFESPKKNKLGDLQVISLIDVESGLAPFDKLKIHEYFAMLIGRIMNFMNILNRDVDNYYFM